MSEKTPQFWRDPQLPFVEARAIADGRQVCYSLHSHEFFSIGAITGGLDFSNYFTGLSKSVTATNLADAKKQGAVLAWGSFLTLTLNFIIVAFVLFMVIRVMNQLKRKEEAKPAEPPKPSAEAVLLTEIRDLLKAKA